MWHPFDDMYHYSDKVKEILDADTERMKGMDWNIEKTEGILPFLSSFFFPGIFIKEKLALRPNAAEIIMATDSPET